MGLGRLKEEPNSRQSPSRSTNGLTQTKQATRASTPEGPVDSPGNPFGPLATGQLPAAYPLTERKSGPRKPPTIQMKPRKKKSTDMRFLEEPSTPTPYSALKPTLLFTEAHRIYRERVPKFNPKMSAKRDASKKSEGLNGSDASSAKSKRKASPAPNMLRSPKQPPTKRRISDTRPTTIETEPVQEVTTKDRRRQIAPSRKMGDSCVASPGIKVLENKSASSKSGVKGSTTLKIISKQKSASNRSSDSRSITNTGNSKITDNNSSEQQYPSEITIIRSILEVAKETGQHDLLEVCQGFFVDDARHLFQMEQLEVTSAIVPWLIGSLRQEYRIRVIQKKLGRYLRDEESECINAGCIRAAYNLMPSGEQRNWKQFTDKRYATETAGATKANGPASLTTQKITAPKARRSIPCKNSGGIVNENTRFREQALNGTVLHRKGSLQRQISSEGGSKKRLADSSASSDRRKQRSEKSGTRHQHQVPQEKNPFDEELGSEFEMENAGKEVMQIQNEHQNVENSDSVLKSKNDDGPGTGAIEKRDDTFFDEVSDPDFPNDNPFESSAQHKHTVPGERQFDEEPSSDVDLENVHKSDKCVMQDPIFDIHPDEQLGSEVQGESADEEPFSEVEDSEPQGDPEKNESEFDIYEDANPFSRSSANRNQEASGTVFQPVAYKLSSLKSKPAMPSPRPIDRANARVARKIARGPQLDSSTNNPFIDRPKTDVF